MKYDIIAVGGATEDITLHTSEGVLVNNKKDLLRQNLLAFEYGAKIKINKTHSSFGGGASNVAVATRLLGLKSGALVAVGNDERGHKIINNFKSKGVATSLVQKVHQESSGFSFLLVGDDNEHIVFSSRGANSKLEIYDYELRHLSKAKWIFITSLSGGWKDSLKKLFNVKSKIAWNPGHVQLSGGIKEIGRYLKKTSVFIVNKDEALELVVSDARYKQKDRKFLNNTKNLLKIIKDFGPQTVVITNGEDGSYAFDGDKFYYQPIIKPRKIVDTTGVGDAFGSSFVAGIEKFNDINKALLLGAKNTASVIASEGAQNGLLTKKDI